MWGTGANCYAYACNCKVPANGVRGAAVPGGYAGQAVFPLLPNETQAAYNKRLVAGIFLDAQKNKVKHFKLSTDINTLPDAGSGYIIGMIAQPSGFHFYRRSRWNNLWTSKNGIGGEVEETIYSIPLQKTVKITDAVFIDALATNPGNYVDVPPMGFVCYVGLGNIDGMTVAGAQSNAHVMG